MVSRERDSVPPQFQNGSDASEQLEAFLRSEPVPDFTEAAERVWHRLELRGFERLRPKARVFSPERVFSAFGDSGQGIAAAAVIVVVLGATLLFMHGTGGFTQTVFTGTAIDEGDTHAAALSVDDIFRLLVEGREAPPITIQIPHSGPFEMRGAPAIRVGTESFSAPLPQSMDSGNGQDVH